MALMFVFCLCFVALLPVVFQYFLEPLLSTCFFTISILMVKSIATDL